MGAVVLVLACRALAGVPAASLCETAADGTPGPPYLALLSAFPAELAPLVAATEVDQIIETEGGTYYTGILDGVSVVLGLTGVGIVNAERAAENVLSTFDVAGLVLTGVAGSRHRIGDVVLAKRWTERDRRRRFRVNRALLALAERGAAALAEPFARCTPVPPTDPDGDLVCLPFVPAVVLGGHGISGDPFGGAPFSCIPGAGEVLGCELPLPETTAGPVVAPQHAVPDVEDMETAAVARVARDRRVPFLGVRAVSDGAGDPLGDRGFPAQFFDYYRLAAYNGGLVTRSLVGTLGQLARDGSSREICERLERGRWRSAARRIAAGIGG